jgi:hypothetical protein
MATIGVNGITNDDSPSNLTCQGGSANLRSSFPTKAPNKVILMNDLIGKLVANLNVEEGQAKGGVGLLLKLAQEQLGDLDFAKIKAGIGDSDADEMIDAAPEEGAASALMGGIAGMLGGGDVADKLGDFTGLAEGFGKLNLSTEMITKFVPMVLEFIKERAGEEAMEMLAKVLKR